MSGLTAGAPVWRATPVRTCDNPSRTAARRGLRQAVRSPRRVRGRFNGSTGRPTLSATRARFAGRRTADRAVVQNKSLLRQKIPAFKRTILRHEPQGRLKIVGNVREIPSVPSVPARLQQHVPEIESAGSKLAEPFGGDARHQIAVRDVTAIDHHADVAAAGQVPTLEDLDPVAMDQGVRMSNRSHSRTTERFAMTSNQRGATTSDATRYPSSGCSRRRRQARRGRRAFPFARGASSSLWSRGHRHARITHVRDIRRGTGASDSRRAAI